MVEGFPGRPSWGVPRGLASHEPEAAAWHADLAEQMRHAPLVIERWQLRWLLARLHVCKHQLYHDQAMHAPGSAEWRHLQGDINASLSRIHWVTRKINTISHRLPYSRQMAFLREARHAGRLPTLADWKGRTAPSAGSPPSSAAHACR